MKIETLEWPCGCKAVAVNVIAKEPGLWETEFELRYCPLHGAAEELRDAASHLTRTLHALASSIGDVEPIWRAVQEMEAALASAESKQATEPVSTEASSEV